MTTQTVGGNNVLLDVRDISLSFGGVNALTDVSYQVNEGELFAVIGPNGAGKTSILTASMPSTSLKRDRPCSMASISSSCARPTPPNSV